MFKIHDIQIAYCGMRIGNAAKRTGVNHPNLNFRFEN
jgi:hypothetical protein